MADALKRGDADYENGYRETVRQLGKLSEVLDGVPIPAVISGIGAFLSAVVLEYAEQPLTEESVVLLTEQINATIADFLVQVRDK